MIYHVTGGHFDGEARTHDGVVQTRGTSRELAWAARCSILEVIRFARERRLRVIVRERPGSARSWDVLSQE